MKYFVLIVIIICSISACKKKNPGPTPDPKPVVPDTFPRSHLDSTSAFLPYYAYSYNGDSIFTLLLDFSRSSSSAEEQNLVSVLKKEAGIAYHIRLKDNLLMAMRNNEKTGSIKISASRYLIKYTFDRHSSIHAFYVNDSLISHTQVADFTPFTSKHFSGIYTGRDPELNLPINGITLKDLRIYEY